MRPNATTDNQKRRGPKALPQQQPGLNNKMPNKKRINKNMGSVGGQVSTQTEINNAARQQNDLSNRPNVVNDYGSSTVTYDQDGRATVTNTLNDAQKGLLDQNNQIGSSANDAIGSLIKSSRDRFAKDYNLGDVGASAVPQDLQGERSRIEGDLYNSYTRDLGSRFAQDQEAERTRLINQGLSEGSAGYNAAMREFNDRRDRAYQDARTAATDRAGQEMERSFGMQLNARKQGVEEYDRQRYAGMNEANLMNAFRGTPSEAPSTPWNTVTTAPVDVIGTANQMEQNKISRAALSKSGGGGAAAPAPAPNFGPPPPPPQGAKPPAWWEQTLGGVASGLGASLGQNLFNTARSK